MIQTPIVQFGTSRFLQAHADLMISEAMAQGKAAGPVTVVQSSGDPVRARRLSALAAPEGFPVRIRGLRHGKRIEAETQVASVRRVMSTASDWNALCTLFEAEAEYVLSNTGDAGYAPQPADTQDRFDQSMSYPAKLRLLLRHRFAAGGAAITVMPMELVSRNGEVLRARVLELAASDSAEFQQWLAEKVIWANSLVDRIVSEPLEPAGAVAEPYALWAIEAQPGLVPPCTHPDVQMVDDLNETEALKLFILNLSHTLLAGRWREDGRPEGETVREILADPEVRGWLSSVIASEVLPGFGAQRHKAEAYWQDCLERFDNPFLDHRLADIAQNHAAKVERRIAGFLNWCGEGAPACPELIRVAS